MPEATTKDSNGFQEVIAGVKSGELSFEGLIAYDDDANPVDFADILIARRAVTWTFGTADAADTVYTGSGFLSSVEMSAEMESPATYSGSITINGATRYCSLVKAKSQKGEDIYEVAVSAGRVYVNAPEDKQNPKSPDVSGKITIDGQPYKFGAWNNVAKSGQNYLGISLSKSDGETPYPKQQATNNFKDDNIPF